jgi:hypothetical protein
LKPLFTIHAGEFLVDCEIERKFRRVNVWIPAKDTGIDLLVSNNDNSKTVSLQVKFSRDYLVTHLKRGRVSEGIAGLWMVDSHSPADQEITCTILDIRACRVCEPQHRFHNHHAG